MLLQTLKNWEEMQSKKKNSSETCEKQNYKISKYPMNHLVILQLKL